MDESDASLMTQRRKSSIPFKIIEGGSYIDGLLVWYGSMNATDTTSDDSLNKNIQYLSQNCMKNNIQHLSQNLVNTNIQHLYQDLVKNKRRTSPETTAAKASLLKPCFLSLPSAFCLASHACRKTTRFVRFSIYRGQMHCIDVIWFIHDT